MKDKLEEVQDKMARVDEMQTLMLEKADKMDLLLKQIAKLLAANTNYASLISTPQYKRNKVRFIQLSLVDETQLLVVVMIEGNIIKNKLIHTGMPVGAGGCGEAEYFAQHLPAGFKSSGD